MTLATQYTSSLAINAVSTSMAQPGGTPLTYMLLMQGGTGVDLQFAKDPEGNIRLTLTSRTNAQMLVLNHDDGNNQEQHRLPAGSTYSYKLTITLPADNLDELAEADWAHYDRKAVTNFDGPIDARVNLIPRLPLQRHRRPRLPPPRSPRPRPRALPPLSDRGRPARFPIHFPPVFRRCVCVGRMLCCRA